MARQQSYAQFSTRLATLAGIFRREAENVRFQPIPYVSPLMLVNGDNDDIRWDNGFVKIFGPTASFAVTGFVAPEINVELLVYNSTSEEMTIRNEDLGSVDSARILTLTGADVVLRAGTSFFSIVYDHEDERWILTAYNGV